ncbi:hypothetical protein BDW42DRAFT_131323 [Aspergillus taichungensis]|uniref:Uncharacterized protein n=1 Tax=Aspergillus taichungensis TaxID=482145 RepID=A0A2J5HPV5_9EURO|nr:hypothetical protein BDW42DRAFT_131323 [Aspergillus taichungensis]
MAKSPANPDQAQPVQSQVPEKLDPPPPSASPLRSTQPDNSTTTSPGTATTATTTTTTPTTPNKPSLLRTWLNFLANLFTRSPEAAAARRQKKARRQRSKRVRARERELRTKRQGQPNFFVDPAARRPGAR